MAVGGGCSVVVSGSDVLLFWADYRADAFGVLFADWWLQLLGLSYDGLDSPRVCA